MSLEIDSVLIVLTYEKNWFLKTRFVVVDTTYDWWRETFGIGMIQWTTGSTGIPENRTKPLEYFFLDKAIYFSPFR